MLEKYVSKGSKKLRCGFTTGTCAAAASAGAARMLLSGKVIENITVITPSVNSVTVGLTDIKKENDYVSCAVQKDSGDDPDVTDKILVYSTVSYEKSGITVDGGEGVGRVTKPGLDQPVGNAAINHVPREMIEKEVREVCALTDETADLLVEISVPEGETLAAQTFNPRLGITGGISILGTSGIVEPMSSRALLETIRVELNQKRAMGYSIVAVSPGNYGLDYMKRTYGYDLDKSVKCSNFIGDTIDMAVENGFEAMLLTGHIGKLIKVAGGIMNTHSQEGDCRMELITSSALSAGADADTARQILSCVTTEEAVNVLKKAGLCEKTMELIMQKIMFYLNKRAAGKIAVACILYSNEHGGLGESAGAAELLARLKEEKR